MTCSAPDCKKPVIITRADPQFEKPLYLCEDHSRELMCSYPKCFMPGIKYKYDIIKCEHKYIQHVVLCDDHADLVKFHLPLIHGHYRSFTVLNNQFA